ncbi:MAG TPA: lysylphosphatidylglycerol synthase domain-containing protein [Flavobacteriales bacterium]|nr:lysylphosphatidylglycerol synthase domain-containing protein [Flavobacteriales bacterium]
MFLRWGVFLVACGFLYLRLVRHADPVGFAEVLRSRDRFQLGWVAVVVSCLMFVNWGLEALKWKLLVRDLERLSFGRAFIATIAGTSIGMITPNRVGEFAGRVLFLAPEKRIAGAFATGVGSIAQFVITIVMGTCGLVAMFFTSAPDRVDPQVVALVALCAVVACCSLLLYFDPGLLRAVVARVPVVRKWSRHAGILERFRSTLLLSVLLLSVLRYVVFTVQFALLLNAFAGVSFGDAFITVPVAFLVSTLVPTVMLTELGVRGSVAVAFISPQVGMDKGVFISSTAIWLVNVALPAMAGGLILLVARIRSTPA